MVLNVPSVSESVQAVKPLNPYASSWCLWLFAIEGHGILVPHLSANTRPAILPASDSAGKPAKLAPGWLLLNSFWDVRLGDSDHDAGFSLWPGILLTHSFIHCILLSFPSKGQTLSDPAL